VTVAAGLVIYQFVQQRTSQPTQMTGNVKIAVARFLVGPHGTNTDAERASNVANEVYAQLTAYLGKLSQDSTPISVAVWPPSQTGSIDGNDRNERARSAANRAQEINADVVLYGTIEIDGDSVGFTPEFYMAPAKLSGAEELEGWYSLGPPVQAGRDFASNPATYQNILTQSLNRTVPLPFLLYGLGNYANAEFETADRYFQQADDAWGKGTGKEAPVAWPGKEVLYLLRGNTSGRLAARSVSQEERSELLKEARGYFDKARQANAEYARPEIGLAEVLLQVYGAQQDCESGHIDAGQIQNAIDLYDSALAKRDELPDSAIETKVHIGRGRALLCLSLANYGDYWSSAEAELRKVVDQFASGDTVTQNRIQELAAQAHGALALIYWPTSAEPDSAAQYRRVVDELEAAATLSHDHAYQARCQQVLGEAYQRLGDLEAATAAYEREARLDPSVAPTAKALQATLTLKQVQGGAN
jgi:tetratricopeptide (TPR) repeat protein